MPGVQRSSSLYRRSGGANRLLPTTLCIGLLLASSVLAGPPPGNIGQLQQLNQANEAELANIQRPSTPKPQRLTEKPSAAQQRLDRQQRTDQRMLQERQRRELLILNHRSRIDTRPGLPYSLRGLNLQGQFQRQQQNQLNRFRLQQGSPFRR
jgi:hypothetical protein